MEERKKEIKRLRKLESLLATLTIAGITLSFTAKSTHHEKLAYILNGTALASAVAGCGISIKKSYLGYHEAQEAQKAREVQEAQEYQKYNNSFSNQ